MITEITDHGIDLTGSEDQSVLVNYTLPSGDWTLSIQVKGALDGSQYGNLFQDGPNYIFDSDTDDTHVRVFGAYNQDYFPIPELVALGEDEWATITITRVGNLLTYYVNGTNYGSITHSNIPTVIETINGWSGNPPHVLAPDVANFRVFEGAATEEEVVQLLDANTDGDTLLDGEDSHPDDFGMPRMQEPAPQLKLSDDDWAALSEDKTSPYQADIHAGDLSLGQIFEIDRSQIGGGYDSQALAVKVRDADNNFVGLINITDRGDSYPTDSIRYVLSSSEVSGFLTGYNDTAPSGEDTQLTVNESLLSSIRNALTSHFSVDINNIEGYEIGVSLKFYHDGREDDEDANGNSYSRGVFRVRPEMILEGYSEESPDTSEEDDSDSDNGEQNETQPMEEINMSEFNFTVDKQSTLTKTVDSSKLPVGEQEKVDADVSTSTAQGSATASPADTCRSTQIMGLLKAKGLDLCGDLQMKNNAEIYTSDGTAVSSFVKAMDVVYGYFNDDSTPAFVHLDPATEMKLDESIVAGDAATLAAGATEGPDSVQTGLDGSSQAILDDTGVTAGSAEPASWAGSTARDGRWYLRLVRMNGAIEFKALAAIDSLFDGVGASPKVASILGALKEVEELQEIVKAALDAERLVRAEQFNALEDSVEQSFKNLIHFMTDLEDEMKKFIADGDKEVMDHIDARLNVLGGSISDLHNKTRFHGIADLAPLGDGNCETGTAIFESGDFALLQSSEITEWMIDVEVQSGTGSSAVRRGDLHIEYTAEITDAGALKIMSAVNGCSNLPATPKLVVNAVYCGDVVDADVPSGSDGQIENSYTAPNTLVERQSGKSMYNDISTDAGHQAGYIVGLTENGSNA